MYHLSDYQSASDMATLLLEKHFNKEMWEFSQKERETYSDVYYLIIERSQKLYKEKQNMLGHIHHALHIQIWQEENEKDNFSVKEAWRCFGLADKAKIVIW